VFPSYTRGFPNPCGKIWKPCGKVWKPWNKSISYGFHMECGGTVKYYLKIWSFEILKLKSTKRLVYMDKEIYPKLTEIFNILSKDQ